MKMKLKKILINITAAVCICISLTGCTKVNENLSAKDIQKSIVETGLVKNMEETGSKGLKRYYGLNSSDFDSVVLYTPESSMEVDEMLIVKVKDKSQIEGLEDTIDNRVNSQLQSFGSYGPEQCGLLNNYELKTEGKYVFFAVSENAEKLKEAFKEAILNCFYNTGEIILSYFNLKIKYNFFMCFNKIKEGGD